jgi:hypothetical protein
MEARSSIDRVKLTHYRPLLAPVAYGPGTVKQGFVRRLAHADLGEPFDLEFWPWHAGTDRGKERRARLRLDDEGSTLALHERVGLRT